MLFLIGKGLYTCVGLFNVVTVAKLLFPNDFITLGIGELDSIRLILSTWLISDADTVFLVKIGFDKREPLKISDNSVDFCLF